MFKPENKLEELLLKAFSGAGHRPEFYNFLLRSDVFVIGYVNDELVREDGKERIAREGDKLNVRHVTKKTVKSLYHSFLQ